MNKIYKVVLMVCMLSMMLCSTCFAFTTVQLNDTLGAGAVYNAYNKMLTGTSYESYKTDSFEYAGPRDDYEIYASFISENNIIEYICNKAGLIDGIVIVSSSIETNNIEAYTMLAIISEEYNTESAKEVVCKSVYQYRPWNWYCAGTNRAYHVNTTNYNGLISTTILAFIQ